MAQAGDDDPVLGGVRKDLAAVADVHVDHAIFCVGPHHGRVAVVDDVFQT